MWFAMFCSREKGVEEGGGVAVVFGEEAARRCDSGAIFYLLHC